MYKNENIDIKNDTALAYILIDFPNSYQLKQPRLLEYHKLINKLQNQLYS